MKNDKESAARASISLNSAAGNLMRLCFSDIPGPSRNAIIAQSIHMIQEAMTALEIDTIRLYESPWVPIEDSIRNEGIEQ